MKLIEIYISSAAIYFQLVVVVWYYFWLGHNNGMQQFIMAYEDNKERDCQEDNTARMFATLTLDGNKRSNKNPATKIRSNF